MEALRLDASFAHVDALSNKAKHSNLIRATLNEDVTGTRAERHEIRFQGFVRKGISYDERKMEDVLYPAYSIASATVVEVGHMVHAALTD